MVTGITQHSDKSCYNQIRWRMAGQWQSPHPPFPRVDHSFDPIKGSSDCDMLVNWYWVYQWSGAPFTYCKEVHTRDYVSVVQADRIVQHGPLTTPAIDAANLTIGLHTFYNFFNLFIFGFTLYFFIRILENSNGFSKARSLISKYLMEKDMRVKPGGHNSLRNLLPGKSPRVGHIFTAQY